MSREAKIMTGIVAAIVVLMVGAFALTNKAEAPAPSVAPSADKLLGPNPHKIGADNAKVTIVEFGDYQCPACMQAHPAVKQVIKDYGDRITFVFRNYPIEDQHRHAMAAAQVAEEAGVQGKFWEMHNKLYETQKDWEKLSSDEALRTFLSYANDLNLDANKIKAAVDDNKHAKRIAQDKADATALSITGTPTFYVNGQQLKGLPDYPMLRDVIEAALKG